MFRDWFSRFFLVLLPTFSWMHSKTFDEHSVWSAEIWYIVWIPQVVFSNIGEHMYVVKQV